MSFEVASVRQNNAGFFASGGPVPHSNLALDAGSGDPPAGGLLSATNQPLSSLIMFAYKLRFNDARPLVSQLPSWWSAKGFDIQARANGNPTKDQFRLMLQSLLAERFKFVMHYEVRQRPLYNLVLLKPGKTGPHLRPYEDETPCPTVPAPDQTIAGGFPATCGNLQVLVSSQPDHLIRFGARNVSMALIADSLPAIAIDAIDRPVFDRTGLAGNFDFILEWDRTPLAVEKSDTAGPTIIEALKEQLGLKLDAQTGPVNTFVVDHIEQPSPN
jgi:uncharacterized protein (TIGR03435 family)